MPLSLFETVIKKIQSHTGYIYLHVKGEPLLHPELSAILDICQKNVMKVVLVTNGTLLAGKGEMLMSKPAVRQINISLHCFSELRDLKAKNEFITSVIKFTRQTLLKSGIIISLRLWNNERNNQNSHPDNQFVLSEIEKEFAPGLGLNSILKPGKGIKLKENLYINSDFEFSWPDPNGDYDNPKGSCYGLRDQIAVLSDGTIVPCCLDAEGIIELGKIQDDEIQQVFESSRAQKIYNGFLNSVRVESLCRKCRFNKKI
jgi:radical SAM protein with 4Fe4S-binding SPASM domain